MSSVYPGQRGRDPQPLGRAGETALVVLCAVLLAVSLTALAGLGAASWLAGGGWVRPHGSTTAAHVLGGLLAGHPGRGLPPTEATRVAGPAAVYVAVAASELVLLVVAGFGWALFARWYRPGDARRGMATRGEAAAVLGTGRLRAVRAILRPDLYGATPSTIATSPSAPGSGDPTRPADEPQDSGTAPLNGPVTS